MRLSCVLSPIPKHLSSLLLLSLYSFTLIPLFFSPLLADWEPEVRLTYDPAHSYTSGNNAWNIAASSNGSVHVVWRDERGGPRQIYYKRSPDGGTTWSADTCLSNTPDTCKFSSIAVADTIVHVVWDGYYGWDYEIYYRRSVNSGLSWGPIVRLTDAWNESCLPSMAVLDTMIHVVWQDYRDFCWQIYYKRSIDNGTTWSPDRRLTAIGSDWLCPSVAVTGSNVHVVWRGYDGATSQPTLFYKSSSNAGSTWTSDTCLSTSSVNNYQSASIAASGQNVNVVWTKENLYWLKVFYKHSSDGGFSWGPDTYIPNMDTANSSSPTVAVSDSNIHLIWSDGRSDRYGYPDLFFKFSSNGGLNWSQDTSLTASRSAYQPSLTIQGPALHLVWEDARNGNYEIYYKRNPTGNSGLAEMSELVCRPSNDVFKAQPNPFVACAVVPGHERERFDLYDISGRLVGTYQGSRVGSDAPPGVYFLKPEGLDAKPFRVVKIR